MPDALDQAIRVDTTVGESSRPARHPLYSRLATRTDFPILTTGTSPLAMSW